MKVAIVRNVKLNEKRCENYEVGIAGYKNVRIRKPNTQPDNLPNASGSVSYFFSLSNQSCPSCFTVPIDEIS